MSRSLQLACLATLLTAPARAAEPAGAEYFEKHIRPLLADRCQKCHGAKKASGGLRLTSREAALKGGDSGPAAVPGKPDESLLIKVVGYRDKPRMPPDGKLSDGEIARLKEWVRLGAPWPA